MKINPILGMFSSTYFENLSQIFILNHSFGRQIRDFEKIGPKFREHFEKVGL
jgi:hypothetical protein